jgi:hypothetical protein
VNEQQQKLPGGVPRENGRKEEIAIAAQEGFPSERNPLFNSLYLWQAANFRYCKQAVVGCVSNVAAGNHRTGGHRGCVLSFCDISNAASNAKQKRQRRIEFRAASEVRWGY